MSTHLRGTVIIAIADRHIGVAIPARGGYQFVAADPRFGFLDGSRFRRVEQIQSAASSLARAMADRPATAERAPSSLQLAH